MSRADFTPDWVSPPGDTIADLLARRGISRAQLAELLDETRSNTTELITGEREITPRIAEGLARALGASAEFWSKREAQYRSGLDRLGERARKNVDRDWLGQLPFGEMMKFGWVEQTRSVEDRMTAALGFFGVSNVDAWQARYGEVVHRAAYRTSPTFAQAPAAVAAWLRQGELESNAVECRSWEPTRFRHALLEVRQLTREGDPNKFLPELVRLCAACGVAVAVVRAPRGCPVSGATWFQAPARAVLLLSFRYLSDDQFWFTFFHEAGHLLLHGDRGLLLEGKGLESSEEEEANQFAATQLIPEQYREELMSLRSESRSIVRFARKVGVSRGVVVGQLQHYGVLSHKQQNKLKVYFRWDED